MKNNTSKEFSQILQFDSQQNPSAYFNAYKVSLTREQQKALAMLLPTKYSFQPFKVTRSLDQESLKSQPKNTKKKANPAIVKQAKDPDYSISHMPPSAVPKEQKIAKPESIQVIPGGEPFMECYLILRKLKKNLYAWPFKQPVDPKALGIPEYLNIVLQPIDLKTIEQNLKRQGYKHPSEFHRDMYKMMMNSYKFNQKNSEVFQATKQFQEEYLKVVKEAKDGKLAWLEKRLKMQEYSLQQGMSIKKQTSQQLMSQPIKPQKSYFKKQKPQKSVENKSLQKIMIKQKQKEKQQRQRQKQRQKDQNEKMKVQDIQKDIYKKDLYDPFINSYPSYPNSIAEEPKGQIKYEAQAEYQPQLKLSKAQSKLKEEFQPSYSNQRSKKIKSKHPKQSKTKERKIKKIYQTNESPNQIKDFKENSQVENEKSLIFGQIKNKLTDLLKRLNDYQLPNKIKNKNSGKITDGHDHPNVNNFTNITAAQKKKLAQKISSLPPSELKYVVEICFRNKRTKSRDQEGIYQIDLQKLDPKILKELSNFVGMRIKKTKKESSKSNKEQIKVHQNDQQIIEQAQDEEPDELQIQDQQQENSLNEPILSPPRQRYYDNLLSNEDHDFNQQPYRDRDNYAPEFQMIESEINEHRNEDYSAEFPF